jgi:hypothetical protein
MPASPFLCPLPEALAPAARCTASPRAARGIVAVMVASVVPTAKARGPASLVKIIDVVCNRQRTHNFSMMMIRLSGSQLCRSRACGPSRDAPGRACRPVPPLNPQVGDVQPRHSGRDVFAPVPCRLTCLSASAERFSGDGVYALCGEHHHQTIEVVLAFINSESLWTWLLGSVTPAYPTRGKSRSPNLRGSYNGSPLGCQVTSTSTASQHADR